MNRKLKDIYGVDFLNQPIYRIVWSPDEIEKRFSTFTDYVPGTNIFLREVTEVRECRKYEFLDPQYVLEKLFVNKHNKEILDNSTFNPRSCTYEPMWCFGIKDGKPLRPIWRAVELIMYSINNPSYLTPSQMNEKEMKRAEEDERIMLELLNEHIPNDALHSSVRDGDTVLLAKGASKNDRHDILNNNQLVTLSTSGTKIGIDTE